VGRLCQWLQPSSEVRRRPLLSILRSAEAQPGIRSPSLPVSESLISLFEGRCTSYQQDISEEHAAQQKGYGNPWQLVRRKDGGEEKEDVTSGHDLMEGEQWRTNRFKEKLVGRCFNCLALDHKRAHCRDPVKCWKCKRLGHTSAGCVYKTFSKGSVYIRPQH
jgi:hypothetical protein